MKITFVFCLFACLFGQKSAAQNGPFKITGIVRDADSREGIGGAVVRFKEQTTVADSAGRFVFQTTDTLFYIDTLLFDYDFGARAVGYEPQNLESDGFLLFPPVVFDICMTRPPLTWRKPVEIFLQPKAVELNGELVITARRRLFENLAAPQAVTVVSEKDFQEKAARSVPEALSNEAGVFLQKTNHGGGSPFVRGLTGQQILMLVDGIRLNSATTRSGPNQYLNALDPSAIGSIEVLRGSGSVEYGSDALGGTVHLRTPEFQRPTGWHGSVEGRTATAGMENSAVGKLAFSNDDFGAMATAAIRDFGDLVGGAGIGRQEPTGYRQHSFFAKIQGNGRSSSPVRLPFTAVWQDETQIDVPIFHKIQLENFARNHVARQRRAFGYLSFSPFKNAEKFGSPGFVVWRQNLTETRESRKKDSQKLAVESDRTETLGARANFNWRPGWRLRLQNFSLQTSLETTLDRVTSSRKTTENGSETAGRGLYPDGSQMATASIFSQISFDDYNFGNGQIGLRGSIFQLKMTDETLGPVRIQPSSLVWNASYSWPIFRRKTAVFAGVSTAFRAPNVDDLGSLGIVDFRYELPNFDLKPEKSTAVETGLKHKTDAFSATAAGYFTRLTDLIGRIRTGDSLAGYPVYRKENFERGFISGLETEAEWRFRLRWSVFGNLTYTFGQNESKDEPLRRIPPVFGKIGFAWQPHFSWKFRLENLFAGSQNRLAQADIDDNRIADDGTPGWATVNFQALFEKKRFVVGLDFQNIFNENYRTHGSGVDGVGRSVWMRVAVRF